MAAQPKENSINLLPKDEFSSSNLGRILAWFLSTFRIMVILVELVVVLAFLSRFWLDSRNADLNDEIEQKQAQILASADFEEEFRSIQKRLKIFSQLTAKEKPFSSNLAMLTSYIPAEVFLSSATLAGSKIVLEGFSSAEQGIAQFIANLETVQDYEGVYLTSLDSDTENAGQLTFTLEIKLKT